MNNLITAENSIEEKIAKKENELRNLEETALQEERVYQLIDTRKSELVATIDYLSAELSADTSSLKKFCLDGRAGKLRLDCGHYICSGCFFRERANLNYENKEIPCIACGGTKQKISNPASDHRLPHTFVWMQKGTSPQLPICHLRYLYCCSPVV
eukprot:TRINITY_DN6336_c0_g1_i2.p2 TRINITY_DN6336_c0_g1~~TRINITY_DN6336_c0_g1_i2.p2  ORF type:complete len:155 (-),score=24.15 TRINITY_DN6336_c0_g1_i2:109-573(-)